MTSEFNPADRLRQLVERIQSQRDRLLSHPIYHSVNSEARLRIFMQAHVFAVWDFMSLLKSLQRSLTNIELPWLPPRDSATARLINEIVLGEETDEDGLGGHASHFELYVSAMRDCGADTRTISTFCERLRSGAKVADALRDETIPTPVQGFVTATFDVIVSNRPSGIAAAFTFGREDVIPDMFQRFVDSLFTREPQRFERFRFYLERHIHLDADDHGPKAMRMLSLLCGHDEAEWRYAESIALASIQARESFWDGVHAAILRVT